MREQIELPEDVVGAVQWAASAVPGHPSGLGELRQRYRRRQRRKVTATAGLAAVVVGVAGGALPYALRGPGDGRVTGVVLPQPAASSTSTPAQRMLLMLGGFIRKAEDGPEIGVIQAGEGIGEVLADGQITYHPVTGVDGVNGAVALADGRLMLLGHHNLLPGVKREDGPNVNGLTLLLVVLRPDGSVESTRDVRVQGEHVRLIGAAGGTAYLERPSGVVAHDLASGAETVIVPASALSAPGDGGRAGSTVESGRVVVVDASAATGRCTVRAFDATTGQPTGQATVPCGFPGTIRVSPDGSRVALDHSRQIGKSGLRQRLVVVDLTTGAQVLDRVIRTVPDGRPTPGWFGGAVVLAWLDDHTLRLGTLAARDPLTRVYTFEELLEVTTVPVG